MSSVPGPILADNIRSKLRTILYVTVFGKQTNHPRSKAFDEIEAKTVEAKLFDQHPRVFKHRGINGRIAVAEMRKAGVIFLSSAS